MSKNPKSQQNPSEQKKPRSKENPDSVLDSPISWHFSRMALGDDCDWSWSGKLEVSKENDVFRKLCDIEKMKLKDVGNKINHRVTPTNKKALQKLEDMKLDDFELQSFHLNGGTRIYCIPMKNIMELLWFDEYHGNQSQGVCPSPKKHT